MLDALLLAIGLSMDAAAVSIVNGIKYQNYGKREVTTSSLAFGFFQGLMPFIGYAFIMPFIGYVEKIDHWVVFGILGFLGVRMILEGLKKDSVCDACESFSSKILLTEAVATSIDALSVGVSLPLLNVDPLVACLIIGVVTCLICLGSHLLGKKLGLLLKDKAMIFGGVILIMIGLKTLAEHLGWLTI